MHLEIQVLLKQEKDVIYVEFLIPPWEGCI